MYLLASLLKELGFCPLGPASKNNLPLILIHRVQSEKNGAMKQSKALACVLMSTKWTGGGKGLQAPGLQVQNGEPGFQGVSEQSIPT